MAVNDIAQLAVQGTVTGQNHVHTLHFRHQLVGLSEQDLIDKWQANCRTAYRGMFRTTSNPVELITARQVCGSLPLRAPAQEVEAAGSIAGTITPSGQPASPHEAMVVSIRTASAGKSFRGRSYIGGISEDDINSGVFDPAALAKYVTYFDTLLNTFGPSGSDLNWEWHVFSPTLAAVPGTQCQNAGGQVTTYIVRNLVATMRSRKVGHGS